MHCDVAIVGGGMGGCIAAGWLRVNKPQLTVVLIEPGDLGGSFKSGGLKYLRWDDELADLIEKVGVQAVKVPVNGGVLLDGAVHSFPDGIARSKIKQLQRRHYVLTRGTQDGFTDGVMNWGGKDQYRIEAGSGLLEALTHGAQHVSEAVGQIHPSMGSSYIRMSSGTMLEAKNLLWTPHLVFLARALGEARIKSEVLRAMTLNVMSCHAGGDDEWWNTFDYVYTSPVARKVHRMSPTEDGYIQVEWNGEQGLGAEVMMDLEDLELAPLLPTCKQLPGHLLPLGDIQHHIVNTWLAHGIRPLGRFAEWDGRATVDRNVHKMREVFGE